MDKEDSKSQPESEDSSEESTYTPPSNSLSLEDALKSKKKSGSSANKAPKSKSSGSSQISSKVTPISKPQDVQYTDSKSKEPHKAQPKRISKGEPKTASKAASIPKAKKAPKATSKATPNIKPKEAPSKEISTTTPKVASKTTSIAVPIIKTNEAPKPVSKTASTAPPKAVSKPVPVVKPKEAPKPVIKTTSTAPPKVVPKPVSKAAPVVKPIVSTSINKSQSRSESLKEPQFSDTAEPIPSFLLDRLSKQAKKILNMPYIELKGESLKNLQYYQEVLTPERIKFSPSFADEKNALRAIDEKAKFLDGLILHYNENQSQEFLYTHIIKPIETGEFKELTERLSEYFGPEECATKIYDSLNKKIRKLYPFTEMAFIREIQKILEEKFPDKAKAFSNRKR